MITLLIVDVGGEIDNTSLGYVPDGNMIVTLYKISSAMVDSVRGIVISVTDSLRYMLGTGVLNTGMLGARLLCLHHNISFLSNNNHIDITLHIDNQ